MTTDREILGESERLPESAEGLDVLLQLTLPIVLILAFVVVTEVRDLRERAEHLDAVAVPTAPTQLRVEEDPALIALQLQLLYAATAEVVRREEEALGLPGYAMAAPSVSDLRAGRLDAQFRATSQKLWKALSGDDRRDATAQRLEKAAVARFGELVGAIAGLDPTSRGFLLSITDASRVAFRKNLGGHVERLVSAATAVQLGLLLEWIQDADASKPIEDRSLSLWRRIQRSHGAEGDANPVDSQLDEFVDLKARSFVETLEQLGAPLLEQTRRQAGLFHESG